jgi:hypothetical protein
MVMVWIFEVTTDFNKKVIEMAAVMLCEMFAVTCKKGLSLVGLDTVTISLQVQLSV